MITENQEIQEVEIIEPRDIDTLMHMSTFEDMTDDEVALVVETHENMAYTKGITDSESEAILQANREMCDQIREQMRENRATIERALFFACDYKEVEIYEPPKAEQ